MRSAISVTDPSSSSETVQVKRNWCSSSPRSLKAVLGSTSMIFCNHNLPSQPHLWEMQLATVLELLVFGLWRQWLALQLYSETGLICHNKHNMSTGTGTSKTIADVVHCSQDCTVPCLCRTVPEVSMQAYEIIFMFRKMVAWAKSTQLFATHQVKWEEQEQILNQVLPDL